MYEMLNMSELLPRRVYELRSRNLVLGVWDPTACGFVGIREKFGNEFLDTEYHWDVSDTFGTARPVHLLTDLVIPEDIPLRPYMGPRCDAHDLDVAVDGEVGNIVYRHTIDGSSCPRAHMSRNEQLQAVLDAPTRQIYRRCGELVR